MPNNNVDEILKSGLDVLIEKLTGGFEQISITASNVKSDMENLKYLRKMNPSSSELLPHLTALRDRADQYGVVIGILSRNYATKELMLLPQPIQDLFAKCANKSGQVFLVGSIIHTLANKQSLKRDQDVDIVCAMQDGELFEADGFKKCLFLSALYTAKMDNMSVDSYVT